jgi:hypothetical protein
VVIASAYHDMKYEKRLDLTSPKAQTAKADA